MTIDLLLFLGLAVVAILAALGMLLSKNAVYSALFLILNFVTVAVFYLILDAPFIAMTQITVYAGAIMVLFLFVIMLLGAEKTGQVPAAKWMKPTALFLGLCLLVEVAYIIFTQRAVLTSKASVVSSFGSPDAIGEMLFNEYLIPFEAISILLLVAMIGAIVLARRKR